MTTPRAPQRESCYALPGEGDLLRRCLPGEYLALVFTLHAVIGALAWTVWASSVSAGLAAAAAGAWIATRSAGFFAGRWFAPLVSGGLLLTLCVLWQRQIALPLAVLAPFSLPVLAVMLGAVLIIDVSEFALSPAGLAAQRRLRRWNWHRIAIWAVVSAFVIYMILIPVVGWVIERFQQQPTIRVLEDLSLMEQMRLRSMGAMTALWFFCFGATIGSFLNVVAYRMPRRESIVFQRSRCPRCGTQIRGRDNVPIFGWLLLGGRCRTCCGAISFRYPVVELTAASLFLLLYFVELISGGANIPVRQPNTYSGVVWIIFYTKWDLVRLYLYHCLVLSSLLAWTLVDLDRHRVTRRAAALVTALLLAPPLIWPDLLPVPFFPGADRWFDRPWIASGISSLVGGGVGAVLGAWVSWALCPCSPAGDDGGKARSHLASGSAFLGLALGWQAVVGVLLLTLAVRLPVAVFWRWKRWPIPPLMVALLAGFVLHHVGWRWSTYALSPWWPGLMTSAAGWGGGRLGFRIAAARQQPVSHTTHWLPRHHTH